MELKINMYDRISGFGTSSPTVFEVSVDIALSKYRHLHTEVFPGDIGRRV